MFNSDFKTISFDSIYRINESKPNHTIVKKKEAPQAPPAPAPAPKPEPKVKRESSPPPNVSSKIPVAKVIDSFVNNPEPRKRSEMASLWMEARDKKLVGYNKLKKSELLKALGR